MTVKKLKKRIYLTINSQVKCAFYEVEEVGPVKTYSGIAARITKDVGKKWAVVATYAILTIPANSSESLKKYASEVSVGLMWTEVVKTYTLEDAKKVMNTVLRYGVR